MYIIGVSEEPLDVIRANEAESYDGHLTTKRMRRLFNEIDRLEEALAGGVRVVDFPAWTPVGESLPEPDKFVLAFVDDGKGHTRRIRAKWVPRFTVESPGGEEDDFPEYREEDDTYYTPEGWYECNNYEETNWKVDDPVTHWMPLPPAPGSVSNEALTEHFPFGEAAHSGKKLPNRHPAEATLRRMLAFAYTNATGGYLYGDDGELQDNRLPWIDFVRDSVEEIEQKIHDRGMQEFIKAQAAKSEPPVEQCQRLDTTTRLRGLLQETLNHLEDRPMSQCVMGRVALRKAIEAALQESLNANEPPKRHIPDDTARLDWLEQRWPVMNLDVWGDGGNCLSMGYDDGRHEGKLHATTLRDLIDQLHAEFVDEQPKVGDTQ